jgi:hypothetical protein
MVNSMVNEHPLHFAKFSKAAILRAWLLAVCFLASYAFPDRVLAQLPTCNPGATNAPCSLDGVSVVANPGPSCPGGQNDSTNTSTFTHGVINVSQRPNGTFSYTISGEGVYSQVPLDPSVPTCTGHFAVWEGVEFNANAQVGCTSTNPSDCPGQLAGNFQMTCTDGEAFDLEVLFFPLVVNGQLQLDSIFSQSLVAQCHSS